MKGLLFALSLTFLLFFSCKERNDQTGTIDTETLLNEMISPEGLTYFPLHNYRTVQFSSFDRRSISPGLPGWFENSDGFGGEPMPGFIATISEPDSSGMGEYLLCDVDGPGAIVRTWTAMINGEMDVYIDDLKEPLYKGSAEKFMWNTAYAVSNRNDSAFLESVFRQNDACYFPLAFSKACRIVWRGDIRRLHFYHIMIRLYDPQTRVRGFRVDEIDRVYDKINEIADIVKNPDVLNRVADSIKPHEIIIPSGNKIVLDTFMGPGQITKLRIDIRTGDINQLLRKNVLKIFFDDASVPQVSAPLGDFFGAAPGINPYNSLPLTVSSDGVMTCRFPMPFREKAVISIENHSDEDFQLAYSCSLDDYNWIEGRSMHFRAKWRIDHDINASNREAQDIPYIMARGRGRYVGTSAFIKNPSKVPSSWGNWWGEGDEKIYVDEDTIPSIFGTGSEDYFNYSWSSSRLFDHLYCGQPRNDGPANRGFVTNYRFHIIDDIVFNSNFSFFMELLHHGEVSGLDYGRIIYYYAPPMTIDDIMQISTDDLRSQEMPYWPGPEQYLGSASYDFIEAEDIVSLYPADRLFYSYLWSEGRAFFNRFNRAGESFKLRFRVPDKRSKNIILTLAHTPESGKVKIYIEGLENETVIIADLRSGYGIFSRNHTLKVPELMPGNYSIIIENVEEGINRVGVDFIWL